MLVAVVALLLSPATAYAAGGHVPLVPASIPVVGPVVHTLGGAVGSIFSTIGGALLGAFKWTISLATNFILTTIAALVKMLIPHSWVHKGLQIMQWIVAVPDYAGKVTSPGGGHAYGFAGINALRDVFTWLGLASASLTLVYATSRAMTGDAAGISSRWDGRCPAWLSGQTPRRSLIVGSVAARGRADPARDARAVGAE
ncbi:MAG TPA: hypothetical protein VMU39_02995, partial [Solirubrobacteraceae bacterium]|nr:hypothetical protein [Solirubrobacteraceae bacterium]